jgi:hypothetical protein
LQVAADGEVDETRLPKGHCRYILLHPEIKGQRCACVCFSLNRGIPSATCDCGHLACFHNKEPDASMDQRQELELLKKRLQTLEEQLSRGHEDVLGSVVHRLNEMEDHLEKSKEEASEQIKGAFRNVSMSWRSIEQAERRTQQHDGQLRQVYEKLRDHDEQLGRIHAGQLELRDADLSLEERIENLTETLEEEEELRLSAAMAARPPRRRSTSDTSRPNVPLCPLGVGAAHKHHPYRSPPGGPAININTLNHHNTNHTHRGHCDGAAWRDDSSTRPTHHHAQPLPSPSPSAQRFTGPWTVHISLLPHAYVPMPFERNTTAYQRCRSRGLHRMVAVQARDAASFRAAVEKAFGRFLRGREWMPLQAKLCDAAALQGLPMLRQMDDAQLGLAATASTEAGTAGAVWDHEFLRRHCAVLDANGAIDSLYIAMRKHTISWHTLRHSSVFMEGLEACWAYDALLDTDPFDGDMAVDDEDRPAAGDITTALPPAAAAAVAAVAGLKRPLNEMSRSNSFSSGAVGAAAAVAAGLGAAPATNSAVEVGGADEQARVKRTCPGPPQAAIVDIRRRDIKTV